MSCLYSILNSAPLEKYRLQKEIISMVWWSWEYDKVLKISSHTCSVQLLSDEPHTQTRGIWMEKPESGKAQGIFLCVHLHVELSYGFVLWEQRGIPPPKWLLEALRCWASTPAGALGADSTPCVLKHPQSLSPVSLQCGMESVCQGWGCSVVQSLLSLSTARRKDEIPLVLGLLLSVPASPQPAPSDLHIFLHWTRNLNTKFWNRNYFLFSSGVWQKKNLV